MNGQTVQEWLVAKEKGSVTRARDDEVSDSGTEGARAGDSHRDFGCHIDCGNSTEIDI